MSLVLVFTATKMEAGAVARLMRNRTRLPDAKATTTGKIGDNQIVLVNTRMGPHNAKAAAGRILRELIMISDRFQDGSPMPAAALITGLAGSLVSSIGEGDLVIYEACLGATERSGSIPCSPELVESMTLSLQLHGLQFKKATGISSPTIAQHDQDRRRLARTGAGVVDMESFEIASCLSTAAVPVAVIRAVSDSPGSSMPDLNRALNPAGEFDRRALASVLAASPLATARLFRASRRAIAALERALDAVLSNALDVGGLAQVNGRLSGKLSQVQK